jgi:single-strand DNA-binding protein
LLNNVVLIGRLTKDPELQYTPNGVAVAKFTLAIDRRPNAQGEKETDFIPIVVWQKQAEACANHMEKGRLCAVNGRIQVRTYNDKNGQRRYVTEIVAEGVHFLERKKTESNQNIGTEVPFDDQDNPFGGGNYPD